MFNITPRERKLIDKVILSNEQLKSRTFTLATEIFEDYKGKELNLLVIIKGAY